MKYSQLERYIEIDREKLELVRQAQPAMECRIDLDYCFEDKILASADVKYESLEKSVLDDIKVCPECGKRYPSDENYCPECLVTLKRLTDNVDIKKIENDPEIVFKGKTDSKNILTEENMELIRDFNFTMQDFDEVMHSIRAQAFKNLDAMIKDNSIDMDTLKVLDKVFLFTKAFANVEYKSYGEELGYFEFDRIYVDDRQRKSLQITTLIHELTHFLIKEILAQITCRILDTTKNDHVESVITYILSYSIFNKLIDEYAAHNVEGRFTVFGYQDYSSFLALQDELDEEQTDIAKIIGNTFAIHIKNLLEGFLDWDVREEIKEQFLEDTIERPDYRQLSLENCNKLSDDGFIKAIWLILSEGFENSDADTIKSYMLQFKN